MLLLSIVSLVFLLASLVLVFTGTRLKEYHHQLVFIFSLIQTWFSLQWSYFLLTGKGLVESNEILGLALANFSLFLPLGFVYISKSRVSKNRFYSLLGLLAFCTMATTVIHAFIASPCHLCFFSPENKRISFNLAFQLVLDFGLLLGFTFLLFDKAYRTAKNRGTLSLVGSVFVLLYINDILVITSRMTAGMEFYSLQSALIVEVVVYLVFSIGIVYLSFLIFKRGNEISIAQPMHFTIDLNLVDSDWTILKGNLLNTELGSLIEEVDQKTDLTKTEKVYLFLSNFADISNKQLSEILCVSPRTVETNKYRLKKKLNAMKR